MATNLADLPIELIQNIGDYLPAPSRIALRLSARLFYTSLPSIRKAVSETYSSCERQALERIKTEPELLRSSKRRCVLCGAVHSIDFFHVIPPICKWHDGWFMSRSIPEHIEPAVKDRLCQLDASDSAVWISLPRTFCLHRRDVVDWHISDCACGCESCGHFPVTCYLRPLEEGARLVSWQLIQTDHGGTVVREQYLSLVDAGPDLQFEPCICEHRRQRLATRELLVTPLNALE